MPYARLDLPFCKITVDIGAWPRKWLTVDPLGEGAERTYLGEYSTPQIRWTGETGRFFGTSFRNFPLNPIVSLMEMATANGQELNPGAC